MPRGGEAGDLRSACSNALPDALMLIGAPADRVSGEAGRIAAAGAEAIGDGATSAGGIGGGVERAGSLQVPDGRY